MTTSVSPTFQGGVGQRQIASPCEFIGKEIAAGSAANETYYIYVPINHYRSLGIHVPVWTAGAGGGTITITVEATAMPVSKCSTTGDYSTLTYSDVTLAMFGAATFTDKCLLTDSEEWVKNFTVVRIKVVVANKDAATTWSLYGKLNT